jgi:hypothetical protein
MLLLLDIWHHPLFTFLQVYLFPSMWAYGNQFCNEYVDEGHITQDCGVEVELDQTSCVSHRNENPIDGKLGYIGKIQEIMQVDLSSFQCVVFCHKWWDTFDQRNVKEDCDGGLICIKCFFFTKTEIYIYIKRHDRGRIIQKRVLVEATSNKVSTKELTKMSLALSLLHDILAFQFYPSTIFPKDLFMPFLQNCGVPYYLLKLGLPLVGGSSATFRSGSFGSALLPVSSF